MGQDKSIFVLLAIIGALFFAKLMWNAYVEYGVNKKKILRKYDIQAIQNGLNGVEEFRKFLAKHKLYLGYSDKPGSEDKLIISNAIESLIGINKEPPYRVTNNSNGRELDIHSDKPFPEGAIDIISQLIKLKQNE